MTRAVPFPGGQRAAQARCLAAAPALAMLMLAPVAHGAMPHQVPLCGTVALSFPVPGLALPPAKKREERQATLCAHATCPRELRFDRKRHRLSA